MTKKALHMSLVIHKESDLTKILDEIEESLGNLSLKGENFELS